LINIHYFKKYSELDIKCRQFIFHYFIRAISAGIAFFIGIYLSHIQMKWLVIGYEVTALSAGYLMGAWLAAQLADKLNPLICSGVSVFIQGLCFIVIAFSTHPILLGLTVFCYGIAGYFYIAVSNYVITSYATHAENRIYAISYFSIASNLGLLLGGVLISYLTQAYAATVFTMVGLLLIGSSWFYFSQKHEASVIQQNNHTDSTHSNPLVYLTALFITFLLGCIIAQQRIGYQIFETSIIIV
jgi:MFS family permease